MKNRREHTRVGMRTHVICIVDSETFRGVSRDLSHGGIQVELPDLPINGTVQLTFPIPASEVIVDAIGSTCRRHGIQFNSLSGLSQQSIRKFVADQTRTTNL